MHVLLLIVGVSVAGLIGIFKMFIANRAVVITKKGRSEIVKISDGAESVGNLSVDLKD